ncbi:MAG: amidohydrolase family protein [Chloroflexota bacterium]|nr:amidohydrolase family protein [Chloroflexota bacterium]
MSACPTLPPIRVDAHHHFWPEPTPEKYPWMTDAQAQIRRPFLPRDLAPHLKARAIERTVLVQTRSALDETREFLAVAGLTDFVAGVVGWVDLTAPDVAETLTALKTGPHGKWLVSIRHQAHDEPHPEWLAREDVRRGLRAVRDAELAYDLLVRPRELPAALAVARELTDMRLVIDHIAKPPIATGELEPWASWLAPFAELEHVACTLSGMVTEADWRTWTADDLRPYVERVLGWFGEDRVMYGSDWPVCELAATYEQQHDALDALTADLGAPARAKLFGQNAARFYRLPL